MSDICVTVPRNFRYGDKRGLAAWLDEGDWPGTEWDGELYSYTTGGTRPPIEPGERVYVVCEDRVVGYSPLVEMIFRPKWKGSKWGEIELVRGGGAVACTISQKIVGFRGWRKRWWKYEDEVPLDLTPWLPKEETEEHERALFEDL